MFKALLWKELRAGLPFALAALLAATLHAAHLVSEAPADPIGIFERSDAVFLPALLAIAFGIALGLWQTVPESSTGTAALLAHMAGRRASVVAAKMLAAAIFFAAALFLPLFIGAATIIARSEWVIPLGWSDTPYLWVLQAGGFVSYLGVLACGLRGLPWKEGFRQLGGLGVALVGVTAGFAVPWLGAAVATLAMTAILLGAWAFAGFATREF